MYLSAEVLRVASGTYATMKPSGAFVKRPCCFCNWEKFWSICNEKRIPFRFQCFNQIRWKVKSLKLNTNKQRTICPPNSVYLCTIDMETLCMYLSCTISICFYFRIKPTGLENFCIIYQRCKVLYQIPYLFLRELL